MLSETVTCCRNIDNLIHNVKCPREGPEYAYQRPPQSWLMLDHRLPILNHGSNIVNYQ